MPDVVYLDNAATTFPKPDAMHDGMRAFYSACGVNPGRSGCEAALQAEQLVHATRRRLAGFFGQRPLDPNRLVFAANATAALNLVLQGTLAPGDHVVTTALEHNSVLRPVNHLCRRGVSATFVRPDREGYVDPREIRRALRRETRLVMVNHASNVIGTVQDVAAIGAICREAGVAFAVDASQTAGVVPIDMAAAHIDFLVFTGHKGLFGPTGTGGVCVAEGARIESTIWGGTGVRSAEPYHLEEFPYRLEAGTLNLAGIAGLAAAHDWLTARGPAEVLRHELELLEALEAGLAGIKGVHLHGTRRLDARVAVTSITVDGFDPEDVGVILDAEYGIVTRTGLQCAPLVHEHMGTAPRGTVRLSIGPFNTAEHIARALRAVAEIASDRN